MAPAIVVENVSKRYRLARSAGTRAPYRTLRDDLARAATYPLRWARGEIAPKEDFWALKDVSFEVQPGEVVGVIGRNGAGKSTLLKVLSRITKPTGGRVRLRGRVGSLLEVGTGFHPELTGRENIFLSGAVLGMKRAEIKRKFDEIVAFAEVEKFLDTPVKRYSSGMYMRLAFAVAAHLEPEILLVDEVLAVGDAAFQKKCLGKMGEVAESGRTVLLVSHNMAAVAGLCEQIAWVDAGRLYRIGRADAVISEYTRSGLAQQLSWQAAKDAGGRLRYARILPVGAEHGQPITVQTRLRFEFEADNPDPDALLNFSVVLYEGERGCVFNTISRPTVCPRGVVRGAFMLPGNFLNDGRYAVRVLVVRDAGTVLADQWDVLAFQVHDDDRPAGWFGRWIGAVRPALDWTVTSGDGVAE